MLEIGSGTGVILDYYPRDLPRLVLSEPEPHMRRQLQKKVDAVAARRVEIGDCGAEKLPFPDAAFDAVVSTLAAAPGIALEIPGRKLPPDPADRHLIEPAGFAPDLERVNTTGAPPVVQPTIKGTARNPR